MIRVLVIREILLSYFEQLLLVIFVFIIIVVFIVLSS